MDRTMPSAAPTTPLSGALPAEHASRAQQQRLVQDWVQLWNGDLPTAQRMIAPGVRVHAALLDGGDGSAVEGPEGMVGLVQQVRAAFPDLRFAIEVGPIIDGDHVSLRWVATGTYGGGFPGAAAAPGTPVTFTGNDTLRVERGQVAEYWLNADTLLLVTLLGVTAG